MKNLLLACCALVVTACNGNGPVDDNQIPKAQTVIAGWQYMNWAWGYRHEAVYFDRDGNQLAATYQVTDSLWQLASNEILTIPQMDMLIAKAHPGSVSIPKDSVRAAAKLARLASEGPYSDTAMVGADMGENEWFGFVFNEDTKMYHRVRLKVEGDWAFSNQSPSAAKLVAMIELYRQVELLNQAWEKLKSGTATTK